MGCMCVRAHAQNLRVRRIYDKDRAVLYVAYSTRFTGGECVMDLSTCVLSYKLPGWNMCHARHAHSLLYSLCVQLLTKLKSAPAGG